MKVKNVFKAILELYLRLYHKTRYQRKNYEICHVFWKSNFAKHSTHSFLSSLDVEDSGLIKHFIYIWPQNIVNTMIHEYKINLLNTFQKWFLLDVNKNQWKHKVQLPVLLLSNIALSLGCWSFKFMFRVLRENSCVLLVLT